MPPSADPDRRCYAFAVDHLLAWLTYAVAGWAAYVLLLEPGRLAGGIAVVAGTVVLVVLLTSLAVGRWRVTPGKALFGLRVASPEHGGPIGFGRALLRTSILGVATLPTLGFGTAALAWTALADSGGRRRGWHDLRGRSVVVDVRPDPPVEEPVRETPQQVVNLTAMRLVPPSPNLPAQPARSSSPPAPVIAWRVRFDTGQTFAVAGLTLVGRRPEARPDEQVQQLVALQSSDMSLSKTHAQFQVVPDGALVVMDRGSTNGTILVRAGMTRRLSGGRPATLRGGDRVQFGDREMTVVCEA